jgi:hypothetical protein
MSSSHVGLDGTLGDTSVEATPGLPDDLAACASNYLQIARVAAPHEDLASVQIDLRLIYRRLPR